MACVKDVDCDPRNTNRICFSNLTMFDSSVLDENGCFCNTLYAWIGDNCDEYSASTIITIVLMSLLFLASLYVTVQMIFLGGITFKESPTRINIKNATCLFVFLTALGNTGWSLSILLSALLVSGPPVGPIEFFEEADPFHGRANFINVFFAPVALVFALLSIFNIVLMFFDIAHRTLRMNPRASRQLKRNRQATQVFEGVVVLAGAIAAIYERFVDSGTSIIGFILFVPSLLMSIGLAVGGIRLTHVVRQTSANRYERILRNVRDTTGFLVLFLMTYSISIGIFSFLDTFGGTWKNHTVPGGIGLSKVLHHLQPLSVIGVSATIYRFIRTGKLKVPSVARLLFEILSDT